MLRYLPILYCSLRWWADMIVIEYHHLMRHFTPPWGKTNHLYGSECLKQQRIHPLSPWPDSCIEYKQALLTGMFSSAQGGAQ